jgi:ribonuclease P protein component
MNISKTLNIVTLSNKDEIHSIMKQGQKVYTKFGLIFLYQDYKINLQKIGILVKKKSGNALKRNYIKRIIRQFVRNEYNLLCHYTKIIFLYNYQDEISYHELRKPYSNDLKKYEKNINSID